MKIQQKYFNQIDGCNQKEHGLIFRDCSRKPLSRKIFNAQQFAV
jgi:hypothetical protein